MPEHLFSAVFRVLRLQLRPHDNKGVPVVDMPRQHISEYDLFCINGFASDPGGLERSDVVVELYQNVVVFLRQHGHRQNTDCLLLRASAGRNCRAVVDCAARSPDGSYPAAGWTAGVCHP